MGLSIAQKTLNDVRLLSLKHKCQLASQSYLIYVAISLFKKVLGHDPTEPLHIHHIPQRSMHEVMLYQAFYEPSEDLSPTNN